MPIFGFYFLKQKYNKREFKGNNFVCLKAKFCYEKLVGNCLVVELNCLCLEWEWKGDLLIYLMKNNMNVQMFILINGDEY